MDSTAPSSVVDSNSYESYLSYILYNAARWDAVVLLDETDIFLEKRERASEVMREIE